MGVGGRVTEGATRRGTHRRGRLYSKQRGGGGGGEEKSVRGQDMMQYKAGWLDG